MSELSYNHNAKEMNPGALEELGHQLERLEKTITILEGDIAPILSDYSVENMQDAGPMPAPSTQFRGHIGRLSDQINRLEFMRQSVDL